MKKIATSIFAFSLLTAAAVSMGACGEMGEAPEDLKVFAPDGAPALALVNAIAQEAEKTDKSFDFEIVDANNIATYVTGAEPEADLCILPVNVAAKFLGSGANYQMLGTVTNGNLYFLTTGDHAALTASSEALSSALLGKKLGVVQLANVPGLTLQVVLKDYNIPYQIIESAQAEAAEDKVNLIAFSPDNVTPAGGCDYYLCPEPAASTKVKGTASSGNPFKAAGDLQELYGAQEGYPQAVAVAKKSVIESRKTEISAFLDYLKNSESYLSGADVETVLRLLDGERADGLTPSFNEKNLTKEVIGHCSVKFRAASENKEKVVSFLEKLIAVNETATAMPDDAFFYLG